MPQLASGEVKILAGSTAQRSALLPGVPTWMWLGGFIAFMTAKGAVVFIGVIVGIDMIAAGVALLITHRWRRFALGE